MGPSTLRLHGVMTAAVGQPAAPAVGAAWLGYSAFVQPTPSLETSTLPISALQFPPEFSFDVLAAPRSTGQYAWAGQELTPVMRVARLVVFDDVDRDGRFRLDGDGALAGPDRLLARSERSLLLFVHRSPDDPLPLDGVFLHDWEDARPEYNLVEVDPDAAPPGLLARVVSRDTRVIFAAPTAAGGL